MTDRTGWRVYISGFNEIDLCALAARWGTVLNAEIRRDETGRSQGFGWADLATREESLAVVAGIRALDDSRLTATVLNPPEIREVGQWPPPSGYGGRPGPSEGRPGSRVGNLDFQPITDFPKDPGSDVAPPR